MTTYDPATGKYEAVETPYGWQVQHVPSGSWAVPAAAYASQEDADEAIAGMVRQDAERAQEAAYLATDAGRRALDAWEEGEDA